MNVRRHLITGEPVLFAPERSARPNAFGRDDSSICPFCPGNERETPPAVQTAGDPWRIRVVPNKYAAVAGHEVIIESSRHDAVFETLTNPAEVLQMWMARYRAHAGSAYVSVFKNEGERAGASLEHIHSQVMPLPFVPPRAQFHLDAFRAARACPLCMTLDAHRANSLVVNENEAFLVIAPSASQHAYEQWIIPKRHQPEITATRDDELQALASILQRSTAAARSISTAQNVIAMNFRSEPSAHFYFQVIPRITSIAGFELGSGTFIDIVDPVQAAERLRGVR